MNIDYLIIALFSIFMGSTLLTLVANVTGWNYLW